jgi:hypothetical protein
MENPTDTMLVFQSSEIASLKNVRWEPSFTGSDVISSAKLSIKLSVMLLGLKKSDHVFR